jgi:hypothetical protein
LRQLLDLQSTAGGRLEAMTEVEERMAQELGPRLRCAEGAWRSHILMRRFPHVVGSIDWHRAHDVSAARASDGASHRVSAANETGDETDCDHAIAFLSECCKRHALTDEWVAFVGYSLDHEYEVQMSALPELLRLVSDVRDHKYIFALDGSWCSMWSRKNELYFGFPPASR